WRTYPARSRNLWLATSASAGASRSVGMNKCDQRYMSSFPLVTEFFIVNDGRAEDMISRIGLLLACALAPKTVHFPLPKSVFSMFWIGFLGLFAFILYAAFQAKKKRRQALEQFAMEMGLMFFEKPDDALAARLAEIHFNIAQLESSA